jgi:hypothetical protein
MEVLPFSLGVYNTRAHFQAKDMGQIVTLWENSLDILSTKSIMYTHNTSRETHNGCALTAHFCVFGIFDTLEASTSRFAS